MTIFRILTLTLAAIATAAAAGAQPPSPGPRGLNGQPPPRVITVSDAEIMAALKNPDLEKLISVVAPAAQLPPHSLRPETLAAIGAEIRTLRAAARARSEAIRNGTHPPPSDQDEGYGEDIIALTQVLVKQDDAAGIDGLAEVVDYGNAPFWALVSHGEAAVPALVRRARIDGDGDELFKSQKSMDALEQMLESKTIQPRLSQRSHSAIRQLAADRMRTLKGDKNWRLLAAAAYLAVATGDPQLRKEVEELANNDGAFVRRGMNAQSEQQASELMRQALEKFPN
jgi:hypothetical protein